MCFCFTANEVFCVICSNFLLVSELNVSVVANIVHSCSHELDANAGLEVHLKFILSIVLSVKCNAPLFG